MEVCIIYGLNYFKVRHNLIYLKHIIQFTPFDLKIVPINWIDLIWQYLSEI